MTEPEKTTGTDISELTGEVKVSGSDTPVDLSVPAFSGEHGAGRTKRARVRFRVLIAILSALCLAYGLVTADQWLLERELVDIAESIVDEYNESDPLEEGEEPTDTECTITITRSHLLVGQATGKISFDIRELDQNNGDPLLHHVSTNPFAPNSSLSTLDHVYVRKKGEWIFQDSWFCVD